MSSSAWCHARHFFSLPVSLLAVLLLSTAAPAARAQVSQPGFGVEAKIRQELKSPTTMEFTETPLQDVVEYLKELHLIEIQLDTKALGEANVGADSPVNRSLKGISLESALKLLLKELELTTVVTDGVLLITTPEAASHMIEVRIYDVGDMAGTPGEMEKLAVRFQSLLTASSIGGAGKSAAIQTPATPAAALAYSPPAPVESSVRILIFQKLLIARAPIPEQEELARVLAEMREHLKAAN